MREEERIIVYRNLIGTLISESLAGIDPINLPQVRHLLSELLESIFDIDSMLYFVAPEWWQPKSWIGVKNPQDVGLTENNYNVSDFDTRNVIGWGGFDAFRPNNYYITGESLPAKLGSSLGWILQLDGNNLRNAFLNAPWVKAVIPIKQGKEIAAINWISQIEGDAGFDKNYGGTPDEITKIQTYLNRVRGELISLVTDPSTAIAKANIPAKYATQGFTVTILDALLYLSLRIQEKMNQQMTPFSSTVTDENGVETEVSYLASEKVYEYRSDPLQGGFRSTPAYNAINDPASKQYNPQDPTYDPTQDPSNPAYNPFQIFDQWIEILPTDQIVAVEVKYDPKSGRQV